MGFSRQEYWSDLHSFLQWTTFCQNSPPRPFRLGLPYMAWLSFIEWDKAVVHVIRVASFLWLWFQSVYPLMPSLSAYCLSGVFLTLNVGYLFTAVPANCSHCSLGIIYFCFIDYAKAFDCVDHNKLWKILKEMGIRDHLTCLLRNLYAGQEATVRTGHGTTDWLQIGKGVHQGCILSPCLFNFYAEYIKRNSDWKKHKLESRLPGEISITSEMQMTLPLWQKVKRN